MCIGAPHLAMHLRPSGAPAASPAATWVLRAVGAVHTARLAVLQLAIWTSLDGARKRRTLGMLAHFCCHFCVFNRVRCLTIHPERTITLLITACDIRICFR